MASAIRDDILVQSNFLLELKARLWGGAAAFHGRKGPLSCRIKPYGSALLSTACGLNIMTRDVMEPSDPRDTGRKPILA